MERYADAIDSTPDSRISSPIEIRTMNADQNVRQVGQRSILPVTDATASLKPRLTAREADTITRHAVTIASSISGNGESDEVVADELTAASLAIRGNNVIYGVSLRDGHTCRSCSRCDRDGEGGVQRLTHCTLASASASGVTDRSLHTNLHHILRSTDIGYVGYFERRDKDRSVLLADLRTESLVDGHLQLIRTGCTP